MTKAKASVVRKKAAPSPRSSDVQEFAAKLVAALRKVAASKSRSCSEVHPDAAVHCDGGHRGDPTLEALANEIEASVS